MINHWTHWKNFSMYGLSHLPSIISTCLLVYGKTKWARIPFKWLMYQVTFGSWSPWTCLLKAVLKPWTPLSRIISFNWMVLNQTFFWISKPNWCSVIGLSWGQRYALVNHIPFSYWKLSQDLAALLFKNKHCPFDNYFDPTPSNTKQTGHIFSESLLHHLASMFIKKDWKDGSIKEANVQWIFDDLGWYFHLILGRRESHALWVLLSVYSCSWGHICCSGCNWPLKLIIKDESDGQLYRYTPWSDFRVAIDGLMYLLVEVHSHNQECNLYQTLLQAACVAQLGRLLYNELFIVVALYVKNSGRVKQYFVFQPKGTDPMVCTFESKWFWVLSPVLPGFLCWGLPRLKETIWVV